jgi:glycosyltransferase involved in cell wall biosynthesis
MKNLIISAVIIALNEEENILDAVKSVSWVDEVIVVDCGSKDRTLEIAKKAGAKTYEKKWDGYTAQKNWANGKAGGEWILSLDADERVTPELKKEIQHILETGKDINGYYIPRRARFLGRYIRHCHWYPDYQLRLFRKNKSSWTGGLVHERVEVEGKVGHLNNDLIHFTYKDIADQTEKLNRYSSLWAMDAFKKGRKTGILNIIISPAATFINIYFFRLGILDGFPGFVISKNLAYYSFQKKIKLYQLHREKKK